MARDVNPPRGMRDFLPAEKAAREQALSVIRHTYAAHGFDEIETPVVEDYDRLRRPVDKAVVRRVRALTGFVRNTGAGADLVRRAAIPVVSRLPFLIERVARIGLGLDHPVVLR